MGRNSQPREKVWAVIRVNGAIDGPDHEHRISVKEIVRSREIALAEVERLNTLNSHLNCWYFCQMSRLFADGESFGTHSDDGGSVV